MKFEWNDKKNNANRRKHGVSFELASLIFQDPYVLSVMDDRYEEERWQSIGEIEQFILYVAHTIGEDDYAEEIIRIISARAATTNEKRRYYANR